MTDTVNESFLKLYKRRWPLLGLYTMYVSANSMQWCEYTIVNNLIGRYYNVDLYLIDWTFECFLLSYIIFCVPVLWMLNKLGLRKNFLISNTFLTIGALIKLLAVNPNRFYLVIVGQVCQAVSQVFLYTTVFKFTAAWFGPDEISLAGAVSLCGDVVGTGIGQILPTIFVPNTENVDDIGKGLFIMNFVYSSMVTIYLVMNLLFFQSGPPTDPSIARIYQKKMNRMELFKQIKQEFNSPGYILFLFCFSLCIAPFDAFSALFNENYKLYFDGHVEYAGTSGLIMYGSGAVGQIIGGFILDRTKLFKTVVIVNVVGCLISMIVYTMLLNVGNHYLMYVISALQGLFWINFYATGFQLAIELTYPVSEDITSSFLWAFNNIHSIIFTQLLGYIVRHVGTSAANIFLCVLLALSTFLAVLIPSTTKRQEVEISVNLNELKPSLPRLK